MHVPLLRPVAPLFACALLLAACGSAPPPEPAPVPLVPPPPSGDESAADSMMMDEEEEAPTSAPQPAERPSWGKMSHEQQRQYMKEVVLPKMSAEFQSFDADEFGQMNCATCHGPEAKQGEFEMPSAHLPKLSPDGKWDDHPPKMVAFMKETVVPEMASLLDAKPYDPQTKTGFGCFECHTPTK